MLELILLLFLLSSEPAITSSRAYIAITTLKNRQIKSAKDLSNKYNNNQNRTIDMNSDSHSDSEIKKIYQLKNIAAVGMSKSEEKPAHFVPKYLIEHGYNVIPVNPTVTEVLGKKSYPSIADVPEKIDIVDVFRRSEDVPPLIDDAIKKKDGIKIVWMQEGIYNEEAEKKARENGIDVVYNRCMMAEHRRLLG